MNWKKRTYYTYIALWYALTSRYPVGENIYKRDWEVAIILDTCRVDAIKQLQSEYEFIEDVGEMSSVGSATPEWLINTFSERWQDEIEKTTRISANGFDESILVQQELPRELDKAPFNWQNFTQVDESAFDRLEILYRGDFHNDRLGTVPPNHITKRSIAVGRDTDWERLMIHYIQPHAPYIADKIDSDRELSEVESRPMWALRSGQVSKQTGWQMYLNNLRLVLDSVQTLINNIDAESIVITADHGESFGEYGGKFGHIDGYLTPQVKKVPWIETTGSDEQTVVPEEKYREDNENSDFEKEELESHLEDLGYF